MSIELVLEIFINAIIARCISERSSMAFVGQESRQYNKTGIHFDDNNVQLLREKHNNQDDHKLY